MKRKLICGFVFGIAILGLLVFLNLTVSTRCGVDGVITEKKIPLYLKACRFLMRDVEMQHLVRQIVKNKKTEKEKLEALFQWVTRNIRKNPKELPAVDDHPWHIIVRGYAASDQYDDIFSLMASYAGFKSFFIILKKTKIKEKYPLAFVWRGDDWIVFDVHQRTYFVDEKREWASLTKIKRGEFEVIKLDPNNPYGKKDYHRWLSQFIPMKQHLKRNLQQFPLKRLWWEITHAFTK